jgi:hypothetical protein
MKKVTLVFIVVLVVLGVVEVYENFSTTFQAIFA